MPPKRSQSMPLTSSSIATALLDASGDAADMQTVSMREGREKMEEGREAESEGQGQREGGKVGGGRDRRESAHTSVCGRGWGILADTGPVS